MSNAVDYGNEIYRESNLRILAPTKLKKLKYRRLSRFLKKYSY